MLAGAGGAPPGLRLVRDEPERIVLAHEPPFHIGAAEFRPATREVLFGGQLSVTEPRVMQLLVALHRAGGSVVTKDELATLCWDSRIVGEDAINRVVSRLRAVAEKQAGGQFRVETITKVGYRLVPANGAAADAPTAASEAAAAEKRPRHLGRRELLIGGAALGIAAAGIGWPLFNRDPMPPDARLLVDGARTSLREATVEQTDNAVGKLRQAVQLAPHSAEAWGMLGYAYMRAAAKAPSADRPGLHARGAEALSRAFALDPHQADALTAQLWATPLYRNWYGYETAARAAYARHPEHPELSAALGGLLVQAGRFREALPLYDEALPKMPLSPPIHGCRAMLLWSLDRLDEAEAAIAKAFTLLPRNYGVWFTQVYFLMYNGRARQAAAMIAEKDTRPLGIPEWNYDLVSLQANALANGDRAEIRRTVDIWRKAAERGSGFTMNASLFAASVGDLDETFRLLNALYFNRGYALPDNYFSTEQAMYSGTERYTYSLFVPQMAKARRDPRFALLTRELGLDDYWRRTNSRSLVIP
jgi:DNA-binding winged helix-turn-helix (wHTH) protein/Flp pilus assembly protein TadD